MVVFAVEERTLGSQQLEHFLAALAEACQAWGECGQGGEKKRKIEKEEKNEKRWTGAEIHSTAQWVTPSLRTCQLRASSRTETAEVVNKVLLVCEVEAHGKARHVVLLTMGWGHVNNARAGIVGNVVSVDHRPRPGKEGTE